MVTLTLGTPATRLAQEQLSEEALLFYLVGEPEESGIAPPGIRMGISEHAKLGVLVQIFGNGRSRRPTKKLSFKSIWRYATAGRYCPSSRYRA